MNRPSTNLSFGSRHGFTIIELLTVVMCIGVLMGISVPIARSLQNRARQVRTLGQFSQWGTAMEMFRTEYGGYPQLWGPYSGGKGGRQKENTINQERFSVALTGRILNGSSSVLSASNTPPSAFVGNTRRLSFYTLTATDLMDADDGTTKTLVDGFLNPEIGYLTDKNGDGVINANDSSVVPNVAGQAGDTYDPKGTGDLDLNPTTGGIRAGVIFYSAGAGNSRGGAVESGQGATSWTLRRTN
jgi:prepilin-type N-terminal cleavage/methylation domain-containing protein